MRTIKGKFTFTNIHKGTVTRMELEIKVSLERFEKLQPIQVATNEVLTDTYKDYGMLMGVELSSIVNTMEIHHKVQSKHKIISCVTLPFIK